MQAILKFDQLLQDISSKNNPRVHKPLKFVNKHMLELPLVEVKLNDYFQLNLPPERLQVLKQNLTNVSGESRICELLVELIKHSEERIERHVELFHEITRIIRKVIESKPSDKMAEEVVEKCSLMLYDSFHFLCQVKKFIYEICSIYQVPFFFEADFGTVRLRANLLATYNNLNTIIDDLQTLSETLWFIRHYDSLTST